MYDAYSIRSTLAGNSSPPLAKRTKTHDLAPIVIGLIKHPKLDSAAKSMKVLLDSGTSSTIIKRKYVKHLSLHKTKQIKWTTIAGAMLTTEKCKIKFKLPEFFEKRYIQYNVHVTETDDPNMTYDMIIGRDILRELGISVDFELQQSTWDSVAVPMKPANCNIGQSYFVQDQGAIDEATERIKRILDAKYEPADLDQIVQECNHLKYDEKHKLRMLLEKYKILFDGTLGHWTSDPYDIELKPDAKPYHAKPYPIPKAYENTLRMEVDRLVKEGVLKKINCSEWAAPTFIIPKKDHTVRFISDFRELNKRIKRKPFPLPKIQDLLLKLEGFQYASSLDLNMGYYHIELSPLSKQLCTIILPWGKYEYQRLPMGLCNSPDIFQEKMSSLMYGLDFVCTYIDDLLCISTGDWDDHLQKLELVFQRLKHANLKVNAKKNHSLVNQN
jgi:hypothetical protein